MLTDEMAQTFHQQGFVVVPNVVDMATVARLRAAFDELIDGWANDCEVSRADYERVVSQWTGLHEQHAEFAGQLHHPTIVAVAKLLLGCAQVQLFHDHLISKPPEHSSTIPWHQDYPFWPVHEPRALSCWLALDDADADSGAMLFMPGAHLEGEKPPADFLRLAKQWGEREAQAVPTSVRAGDCVFHSCLSWHTSPPNGSQRQRRAFIQIMMDADCRWAPEHSDWHPMNDCVTVAPGERFNEDRFPILGARSGDAAALAADEMADEMAGEVQP